MLRLHQSKYVVFIMMLAFAILQFEVSAHNTDHHFGDDDCVTCQILNQSFNFQSPDNLFTFSSDRNYFHSFFFLDHRLAKFSLSAKLSRAPPQLLK